MGGRRWFDTFNATHIVDQSEVARPQDAYFEPEQQTDRYEESTDGGRLALTTLCHFELSTDSGTQR